jgi:hypothetical protein
MTERRTGDWMNPETLQRLADRRDIEDCLTRYARGVDRADWAAVRSTYHSDAHDQHGDYRGGIDGLVDWLHQRFAGVDNSMHFLGNCLIEFVGPDHAFVETYFSSRRLRPPTEEERRGLAPADQICREAWGRYADQFERRDGEWRVARRVVVIESLYASVARGGQRSAGPTTWGRRDLEDASYQVRNELFMRVSAASNQEGTE